MTGADDRELDDAGQIPETVDSVEAGPLTTVPTSRWRVKLYRLEDDAWKDYGTGFCWGDVRDDKAYILMNDENAPETLILESRVHGGTHYQKQDTLIIWNEEIDGEKVDIALSFQEVTGCVILCEFLVHIHRVLEPDIMVYAVVSSGTGAGETTEVITESARLPPLPTRSNLDSVINTIARAEETQYGRDSLVVFFTQCQFLERVLRLFRETLAPPKGEAEQLVPAARLDTLHMLSRIVKSMFVAGDASIIDMMVDSEYFDDVLGILEYDPEFASRKGNYREFMATHVRFNQVAPNMDESIVEKIQKTYRLQLLKDVVLARVLDDATFNLVSSIIYVNQVEIVLALQSSADFSVALFSLFTAPKGDVTPEKQEDGLRFIFDMVNTSKTFQSQQRSALYTLMLEYGLLDALTFGLAHNNLRMQGITLEIISIILTTDPNVIRFDKDGKYNSQIMDALVQAFVEDRELSQRLRAFEAIKTILEPDIGSGFGTRFMQLSAFSLFEPLQHFGQKYKEQSGSPAIAAANGSDACKKGADPRPQYFELVLDLLGTAYAANHEAAINIIPAMRLWDGIAAVLAYPPSKASILAAIRCTKQIIISGNAEELQHIILCGALEQLIQLVIRWENSNTMLSSAALELLKIICTEPDAKYAMLRQWLLTNVFSELSKLEHLPFVKEIMQDDATDDDMSRRKRISNEAHTRTVRRRVTMDGMDTDIADVSDNCTGSQDDLASVEDAEGGNDVEEVELCGGSGRFQQHDALTNGAAAARPSPDTPRPKSVERRGIRRTLITARKLVTFKKTKNDNSASC